MAGKYDNNKIKESTLTSLLKEIDNPYLRKDNHSLTTIIFIRKIRETSG